jgi:hypothetical protein
MANPERTYTLEQFAGKYVFTWPLGKGGPGETVHVQADRLRLHKDGRFTGRLKILVHLVGGRAELHQGQLNFAAVRSRRDLASALTARLDREDINWEQIIEDICREVTDREEQTVSAQPLMLVEASQPKFLVWPLILERLPVVWYGPGGSGKTMVGLYFSLLVQNGLAFSGKSVVPTNVLYCDWEVDREEAERRISFLARHIERTTGRKLTLPHYRRCVLPLFDEASDIAEDMVKCDIGFLVVDSAGPACGGDIQSAELAIMYFNSLRKICANVNAGSVSITHVTKAERREGQTHRLPIGSIYFENLPRATWELRIQETKSENEMTVGFFCRKSNLTRKPAPFALKFSFENEQETSISLTTAEDIMTEDRANETMVLESLDLGALPVSEIAEKTDLASSHVRVILTRLKQRGKVINIERGKWGLLSQTADATRT